MWITYACLSALTAALVAIFAKPGLKQVDPTLATTIRSIIMAVFLVIAAGVLGKFTDFTASSISSRDWLLIVLAGASGALSWLFYFLALRTGPASAVVAIDRMSIVFVVLLAVIVLGETFSWRLAIGSVLMVIGAVFISLNPQT